MLFILSLVSVLITAGRHLLQKSHVSAGSFLLNGKVSTKAKDSIEMKPQPLSGHSWSGLR